MSGNARRRRPRAEKRETQVRTSCGYSHWWWPSPPHEGQSCICGEKEWVGGRPAAASLEDAASFDPSTNDELLAARRAWRP
jgi:hypothetical protein